VVDEEGERDFRYLYAGRIRHHLTREPEYRNFLAPGYSQASGMKEAALKIVNARERGFDGVFMGLLALMRPVN
jgi:hypothetical protein